jgi:nicotinate-nucleotide pyrophosphorylase (carboxylating)
MMIPVNEYPDKFIELALNEDIGNGDHTSLSCLTRDKKTKVKLLVKEDGVLSGLAIALKVFAQVDPSITTETFIRDGAAIKKGDIAFVAEGPEVSLIMAERLALNFMQRMSGVATLTSKVADAVKDYPVKILDTRKTTPGFRYFEKLAVTHGGGSNHRFGLYDMIMLKDNHIDICGGIEKALKQVRTYLEAQQLNLDIVIEARTLADVEEICRNLPVKRILLDNFSPQEIGKAVELINHRCETEASGGITLDNILDYAKSGVDCISLGALTHSYKSLDLSLKAC